jgi:hypothetical protein
MIRRDHDWELSGRDSRAADSDAAETRREFSASCLAAPLPAWLLALGNDDPE